MENVTGEKKKFGHVRIMTKKPWHKGEENITDITATPPRFFSELNGKA